MGAEREPREAASPDAEVFSKLFDDRFGEIWRFIRRRVGSSTDADDLTADVFMVAWRRFESLPAIDERRPWLFGVARNVVRNHRRSTDRRLQLVRRLGLATLEDHAVEMIVSVEADATMWRALAALRDDDRDLLLMRGWDQLSIADMAVVLGCTPNAVSVRLHRARGRLRSLLPKESAGGGDQEGDLAGKGELP